MAWATERLSRTTQKRNGSAIAFLIQYSMSSTESAAVAGGVLHLLGQAFEGAGLHAVALGVELLAAGIAPGLLGEGLDEQLPQVRFVIHDEDGYGVG